MFFEALKMHHVVVDLETEKYLNTFNLIYSEIYDKTL
jgi:hypothetical protein